MPKKKIAAITTEYRKYSHPQHIVDRFLEGYGWHGRHHVPDCEIVSMYVDQTHENDLGAERAQRHGFPITETIAEALTLGGSGLAVDGVLLIGEHGRYDHNEKGQALYPRYDFFKQIVDVFRDTGKSAPVFNDKHLSYDWHQAVEMVRWAEELDFAFMAGSSLPVTWRLPELEFPLGVRLREAVCVCYGGVDSYDFHGLETIQCMVERRAGGESGVKAIQALRGEPVWEAIADGLCDPALMHAAIARSHTRIPQRESYSDFDPGVDSLRESVADPVGYFIEHEDGLRTSMLLFSNFLSDFNFAARMDDGSIQSTQMYLPMPPRHTTLASFFSPLCNNIEKMFETGRATYPVERTLLTTGETAFAVDSLFQGGARIETPELAIRYEAPSESHFWRA